MNYNDFMGIILFVLSTDALIIGLGDIPIGNIIISFIIFCCAMFIIGEQNHWKDNL